MFQTRSTKNSTSLSNHACSPSGIFWIEIGLTTIKISVDYIIITIIYVYELVPFSTYSELQLHPCLSLLLSLPPLSL
jgi:hypothetical protein